MKQQIKSSFFHALVFSLFLVSCNEGDKKTEATSTDTAAVASTTDKVPEPAKTNDLDAVKTDPAHNKVLADTAGIRILEINYNPGDSSTIHSHPDNVLYIINGAQMEVTKTDGTKETRDFKSGMAVRRAGVVHSVKNIGKTALKAIMVEVNRPNTAGAAMDAAMDPTKVAAGQYKVLVADSMNIRVLLATYKPGESSAMHSHATQAVYVVEGSEGEFTNKDGSKQTMKMEKGSAMIIPGTATHAVKNTGKTTMKALIVEVNRP